jgi:hypothetical protein
LKKNKFLGIKFEEIMVRIIEKEHLPKLVREYLPLIDTK